MVRQQAVRREQPEAFLLLCVDLEQRHSAWGIEFLRRSPHELGGQGSDVPRVGAAGCLGLPFKHHYPPRAKLPTRPRNQGDQAVRNWVNFAMRRAR